MGMQYNDLLHQLKKSRLDFKQTKENEELLLKEIRELRFSEKKLKQEKKELSEYISHLKRREAKHEYDPIELLTSFIDVSRLI